MNLMCALLDNDESTNTEVAAHRMKEDSKITKYKIEETQGFETISPS